MGGATGWEPGRIGGGRGTGGRREKLGGRVPRGLEAGKKYTWYRIEEITEENSGKISIFIVNVVISISMQSARF